MLSLLLASLIVIPGPAASAVSASPPNATVRQPMSSQEDAGTQACQTPTSTGGAKVQFCYSYGEGRDFTGGRMPMWLVTGTVYGESFGQVKWVNTDGTAVWQSTARPTFVVFFPWCAERPQFRACNSNGCGAWVSA
ncbi:hypothetical protein [Catelliglobosispora koreensis]|uniref:hypothetical protein n=1 Tax=Catelliglobosispora koreensis TaxID=129052 RepID=UPI0012F92289|nr:hypothetical protein [Catelliglobosispora koreensis]